jgi:hypothetical protein
MERGWGVRLFNPNGSIHSEAVAKVKSKIGPVCRDLLRWYDKCTFYYSRYTDKARHRAWSKGEKIGISEHDKEARFRDMHWTQKHMENAKH